MKMGSCAKRLALSCALACCIALVGCAAGPANTMTEEQQANRAYMSQVNESMVKLDSQLDSFIDAVSRGDVVNMRTQAENAGKVLDELGAIEAPEALADVSKSYNEGTAKLREALDAYITLYSEAQGAGDSYDWDAYDKRIAEVQKLYDEGVALLEAGDKAAAAA